ncbi:hypothetical protein Tco_0666437, partial [Tanacetum coccineum]
MIPESSTIQSYWQSWGPCCGWKPSIYLNKVMASFQIQHISERLSRVPGLNEIRNPSGQQPEDASERSQPNLQDGTFTLPSDVSMESLQQLTRQLGDQENVSDPVARSRMQTNALRSGALLQNLGAFLLELGRTTMTLRLGQSSMFCLLRCWGPAVFTYPLLVSKFPIMGNTLPFNLVLWSFEQCTGYGSSFPAGSGSRPRNIDIRIRTGSVLASTANPREASGREQSTTTDPAAASDHGVSNREAGIRNLSQPRGGPDVRVVPIRVSTLPPGLASSEPRRSSVSIVYPVLARAQHADSSNVNGSHSRSAESRPPEAPEIPGMAHGHSFTTEIPSGLDQLLRNLFPGEPNHGNDFIFHRPTTGTNAETAQTAVNSQEAATVEENQDRGASSSRPDGLSSPPSPKRRK